MIGLYAANPKACFGSYSTVHAPTGTDALLHAEGCSSSIAPSLAHTDVAALYRAEALDDSFDLYMMHEALESTCGRDGQPAGGSGQRRHLLAGPESLELSRVRRAGETFKRMKRQEVGRVSIRVPTILLNSRELFGPRMVEIHGVTSPTRKGLLSMRLRETGGPPAVLCGLRVEP
ncbi:MAG: hypothetical protein ABEL04_10300 [Salinibacter sp.]|uniref:hypothetical protein n=1 Tax=Salinibacter sp. TaxID=2065818 RepID=UPI0035D4D6EC